MKLNFLIVVTQMWKSSNVAKASFIPQHPNKWGYRTVKRDAVG